MTQSEKEIAIKSIKSQLENGYIDYSETFDHNEIEVIKWAMLSLSVLNQIRWERNIAIGQLNELGIGLGEKVNHVKELIERDRLKPPTVSNKYGDKGVALRCSNCFESIGSNYWNFCPECGQRISI